MTKETELTGLPLQHAFLKAIGAPVIGPPEGPFAAANQHGDMLVFAEGDDVVRADFETTQQNLLMELALRANATMTVERGVATCKIASVTCHGTSFAEAVMRAIVAAVRKGEISFPLPTKA